EPTPRAQPRELARPTPRVVLRSLVRQHLLRGPVVRDRPLEHLPHQRPRRRCVKPDAHHIPAVIVQEPHQVQPPPLPLQQEREQVRLPQLVRPCPLELPRLILVPLRRPLLALVPRLPQHPQNRPRTRREPLATHQHVVDPLPPPVKTGGDGTGASSVSSAPSSASPSVGLPVGITTSRVVIPVPSSLNNRGPVATSPTPVSDAFSSGRTSTPSDSRSFRSNIL